MNSLPLCVRALACLRAYTQVIPSLEGLSSTSSGLLFSHIQSLILKKLWAIVFIPEETEFVPHFKIQHSYMVFSMGKHYCSSKHYLYFVALSLTVCPLNHYACSTMCVSGHFSSYIAFLCTCLSPRVRSEFESISPSVHSRTSINTPGSVLWQYPQSPFCHNLLCDKCSEWESNMKWKVSTLISCGH